MKEVARNILFAIAVITTVILWYGFSNNFTGVITNNSEIVPTKADVTVAETKATSGLSNTVSSQEDFLQGAYCRAQHDDLLKRKSYAEIVEARKNDPQKYDVKCFMVNESADIATLERCLLGVKNAAVSESVEAIMCQAFLKVYQTYVTDFLYPDNVDIKTLPQAVLQRKIQAQMLKRNKNPQLLLVMTQTLLALYPNSFEALKIYIKALGFGQKPEVYAEGGPLFPHLVKAYSLNPRDLEIREMYMYALIHSTEGEAKLLKTFPNVKEEGRLQALRYYYLAWAGWNKGDRTQALNNLEFAKSLSNNDPRFTEAYDKVKDQMNVPKSEGLFYLSFSLI